MDKSIINSGIAAGISVAWSLFVEKLPLTDMKTIKQAAVIGGSVFANDMLVKPFLIKGNVLSHNIMLKSVEEIVLDAAVPSMIYMMSAHTLGISKGYSISNALRAAIPSVAAPMAHSAMEAFMPKI